MENRFASNEQGKCTEHPIVNRVGGVFLHVRNMERSVSWYHKLLGLPKRSGVTAKVHDLPTDGGSNLVLDQHGYDRGLGMGDRPILMFDSPDVHAARRYLDELGVHVEWEIEQYPGMAFFTFRDPDGNLLMVCGPPGSEHEHRGTGTDAAKAQTEPELRYDGGGTQLAVNSASPLSEVSEDGLELTGRALTEQSYSVPLTIETTVRLEGGSLRLLHGDKGMLTFNYGPSAEGGSGDEFYVAHPVTGKTFDELRKGALPTGEWVRIEWTIHERSMEVRVNGELFHSQQGFFGDLCAKAGIGCDNGKVTVRSFSVESPGDRDRSTRLPVGQNGKDWLVPDAACYPVMTGEGLWLAVNERWGSARTNRAYPLPFVLEAEVRSDTNSVILYAGSLARVQFHSNGALSFVDPETGSEWWTEDEGKLPDGDFATVTWTMDRHGTSVAVNGEVRFERRHRCDSRRFVLGVGPDHGCALEVKAVRVRPLP